MEVAVFHAKNYDVNSLTAGLERRPEEERGTIKFRFIEARLSNQTVKLAEGAKAICVFVNDDVSAGVLDQLAEMGIKGIALRCAGFDRVDVEKANEHGITVMRVPAYSPHAVAEHCWALILALTRKIPRAASRTREFNFELDSSLLGMELHGRTLGIIGTGKIGQLVAGIGSAFGMRVVCYDKFRNTTWAEQTGALYFDDVKDVFREADVLSLHVPLFPETKFLINEETIKLMKNTSFLVNTSRGGLIKTSALLGALRKKELAGVALDVVHGEEEFVFSDKSVDNIMDDDLARLSTYRQAIITGHMAYFSDEALKNIADITVNNLLQMASKLLKKGIFDDKELPENVVEMLKGMCLDKANLLSRQSLRVSTKI